MKLTKLDFEFQNGKELPAGIWFHVADFVKEGSNGYERAKRRFAVSALVDEINKHRDTDEDWKLKIIGEVNRTKLKASTEFEKEVADIVMQVYKLFETGGLL